MSGALSHLLVIPVVMPLMAAAAMLLLGERRRRFKSIVNIATTLVSLLVAIEILACVDAGGVSGTIGVYLAANWEAPFGIVLVADRLSALMLVLSSAIALGSAVYAAATWNRAGSYFHPLFQIQLMGVNGAFLTGDLFNLFVFFEVLLAASYGLQLHGSGWPRVRSGLHYIAVNLLASSLFLIGLAMLYGVMGTLSMADIAAKLPYVAEVDRGLLHAGAAIVAVAFLTKAATWPLNSWLVPAYTAASAPVAALFALMTKVGVYTLLRLSMLFFAADAGPSAHFGAPVLLYGGFATLAFGVFGLMASLQLGRIAAFSLIVSSGTLLSAIGIGDTAVTSAALYYLLSATPAASTLFLLVELVERTDDGAPLRLTDVDLEPGEDTNLDDDETPLVGRVFPVSLALLGVAFIASALLVAGLPPLSGFIAKFSLMAALLSPEGLGQASAPVTVKWLFFGLLLLAGLFATIALTKSGIRHFWTVGHRSPPHLKVFEGLPVLALLLACVWLTVRAEPVLRYTRNTADQLHSPKGYISAVLSAKPLPGPTRPLEGDEVVR